MLTNSIVFSTIIVLASCYSPFKSHHHDSSQRRLQSLNNTASDIFDVVYQWKIIDFLYPSLAERSAAIASKKFIPTNNLPLGIDRHENRLFITTPRWNPGVPATLSYLPLPVQDPSLPLIPYPDWDFHTPPHNPDCSKLVSVYRIYVDECQRLWVLDAGVIDTLTNLQQICPPKILAFDLHTDRLLFTYILPADQVKQDSLHTNIIVDIRNGKCNEAHAYVTDVWRYGIIVFSLKQFKSWRTTNYLYNPNPMASDYNYLGLNFQWSDGVFGISLSPIEPNNDRILFFHPMSSFTEFAVPTSVLQNESIWQNFGLAKAFKPIGNRGLNGQSSTSGVTVDNVQFFTLVQQSAIGCWDLRKPYSTNNIGIIGKNGGQITFPNDLKLDRNQKQSVWVLSNHLPKFLYSTLDYSEVNFKVLNLSARKAVAGSICDPNVKANYENVENFECY